MGSSAPKSETVVKGGKPTIVREYLSPDYLKELSGLASYYQQRAQQAAATRQSNVNRYLSEYGVAPVYDPYKAPSGEVIQPYQAPPVFDTSSLVQAAEESNMFEPPRGGGGGKKKKEQKPRESYLGALNASKMPVNVNN